MPLFLAPGEQMRRELRIEYKGGFLSFFTPSTTIQLTDRRVAITEAAKMGSEVTKHVPLEQILYVLQGQFSSPRWLFLTVILAALSVIGVIFTAGLSLLMLIPAAICLLVYWLKRSETLVIDSGASDTISMVIGGGRISRIEDTAGNRIPGSPIDEIIAEMEQARQERVDQ